MTMKINPGCDIPPVKIPPVIGDFFTDIAASALARSLLTTEVAKQAARDAQALKDKLADADAVDARIKRYTDLAKKFTEISCPLPKIPDPEAKASF